LKKSKAFTLIELLIVMAVIAILIAIAIPSFRGMQNEARKTKAQGDLRVLKIAIESYYKNHNNQYPAVATYQTTLTGASPRILDANLYDPFVAGGATTYVYALSGTGPTDSNYYLLYSVGPDGVADSPTPTVSNTTGTVTSSGDAIWESNGHI
jgi:prepilin-type N-terminal cleavage/methylation domain-containing protein